MANLFDSYNIGIAAVPRGTGISATTDAITGEGILSLLVLSGGRYPIGGSVFIDNPDMGDKITQFEIRDIDGVIPSPARSAFPSYPTLLSRIENQIYFPPNGIITVDNSSPVFLSQGLYLYIKVVKINPSAETICANIQWLVPS